MSAVKDEGTPTRMYRRSRCLGLGCCKACVTHRRGNLLLVRLRAGLAQALHHRIEPAARDAEQPRRRCLVAARALDGGEDQVALERVDAEARDEQVGGPG